MPQAAEFQGFCEGAEPVTLIYNANPEAVSAATGRSRSAEVNALGNPQGKGFLALEIRRPGPTFRAWDHVRFPLRPIDVDKTLEPSISGPRDRRTSSSPQGRSPVVLECSARCRASGSSSITYDRAHRQTSDY